MKFLSISYIATLAASAIAVPGPLHARNLSERDLDVYPRGSGVVVQERNLDGEPVDNLFARYEKEQLHQKLHREAATYITNSQTLQGHASVAAATAAREATNPAHREGWNRWFNLHVDQSRVLEEIISNNEHAASLPNETEQYGHIESDVEHASVVAGHALKTIVTARSPVKKKRLTRSRSW